MAIKNTRLVGTTPTNVFTATSQQAITVIYLCNTSANTVTLNVYLLDSSSSITPSASNTIYSQLQLTAGDTYIISQEKLLLNTGDLVEVQASSPNSVTVTVSYINI